MNNFNSIFLKAKRITQLDLHYFLKSSSFALFQQIIGVTCGLAVSYLFGHFVSKEIFGEYNLVLSFFGLLTFLGLPDIDTPLIRSVSQGFDGSLKETVRLRLKLSRLGLPILLGLSVFYSFTHRLSVAVALLIGALLFPFINTYTGYPAFLTAKRKFLLLSTIGILSSLFFLISIAIGVFVMPTTSGLTLMYLIAIIIPALVAYIICNRFLLTNDRIDSNLAPYGTFLTLLSILPWISGNLGNIILGTFIGPESLAIFAVASRFLTAVQKNFVVFYKPVTAKLAAQSSYEHLQSVKLHALKLLFIGLFFSALLWISLPFLITFFFTQKYSDAIIYGRWLSLALIPMPITWVLTDIVIYQKRKKAQVIKSTVPNVIKIILYLIIIPVWKIEGLVFITLLDRYTEPIIPLISLLKSSHKS